jgi:GTPase involved in cell partitioning and DNA repair
VLVCDPRLDSLLHLHRRKTWAGARGAQGNPAVGSAGPKRNTGMKKAETQPLEIPVPPGTVVRRKSSGVVLGELLQPGERLLLAKGGKGGVGVRAPSRLQKQRDLQRELRTAEVRHIHI